MEGAVELLVRELRGVVKEVEWEIEQGGDDKVESGDPETEVDGSVGGTRTAIGGVEAAPSPKPMTYTVQSEFQDIVRVLTLILDVIPVDDATSETTTSLSTPSFVTPDEEEEKKSEVDLIDALKGEEQLNSSAPELVREIYGLLKRGEAGGLVRSILARQATRRLLRALAQY